MSVYFQDVSVKTSFETIYFYLSLAYSLDKDIFWWKFSWFGAWNNSSPSSNYFAGDCVQYLHRWQEYEATSQLLFLLVCKNLLEKASIIILHPLFIADKNPYPLIRASYCIEFFCN